MSPLFRRPEMILVLLLVGLCALATAINPAFFAVGNLFDLLKSSATMGLFAMGLLVVMISGGIDISFPAIAAFSMYATTLLVEAGGKLDHLVIILAIAGAIGAGFGGLNAALIHYFRLPPLIVTLATASAIRGALLAFVGTRIVINLPSAMTRFAHGSIFNRVQQDGSLGGGLAVSALIMLGVGIILELMLVCTTIGRRLYALGGDPESARRTGLPISSIRFFAYGLTGLLAGVAGIIHASQMRLANPFDIVGVELTVIAAVILGGASLDGGKGTVIGVLLGVFILTTVQNSLVIVGVPSEWQSVALGVIILGSVGLTSWRSARVRG